MGNNELIKHEAGLIKRVGNAINVTNKLLALAEPQLIPYRKKDKWGFCTPDKNIVIDCIYDNVGRFSNGLARVEMKRVCGFIDAKGNLVIPFIYDCMFIKSDFSDELAAVAVGGKPGFGFRQQYVGRHGRSDNCQHDELDYRNDGRQRPDDHSRRSYASGR